MKKISILLAGLVGCVGGGDLAQKVDQRIGTGGHGHVFMGANVPFGAVQLGPTSIPQEWDWTSGYHSSDNTVIGFSHTHLSGTGIGDLSDIALMPTIGGVKHARGEASGYETGQWSYFSEEKYAPGYYATKLDRWNIGVELTATVRAGFHRYTFPAGTTDARILVDLANGQGWDKPIRGWMRVVGPTTVEGYRYSTGWANDQRIYFVMEFSQGFESFGLYDGDVALPGDEAMAERLYGEAVFGDTATDPVMVKVAISPVSVEGARQNLAAEIPAWDFDGTVDAARAAWNGELGKIKVKVGDESVERIFYTALYHTMVAPSLFCDLNGQYRGADGKSYKGEHVNYTTFSLWDTYRAAHPLMTIIHPEKVPDMINTMLNIYRQQGKLPVWHLAGCETDCMVGNPGIPVVADAVLKGFGGFDTELAYEAMRNSAMLDERGLDLYRQYGYIPFDKYNESVATCLEYALADWALSRVAAEMGQVGDAGYFGKRSGAYKHYFDKSVGFLRGKDSQGNWRTPFNPFVSSHREDDYTEGNAWQYTWLVPHDVEGLAAQFGGREAFFTKLDSLFVVEGDLGAEASPDISGLIGQYAHGNEPSHHVLYFYTMMGRPWRTAELVRRVMAEMYRDEADGLSGNEDVGQMSAWYVLSALGFYQVEPAGGRYFFGSPLVDEAEVSVGGGRVLKIVAKGNSEKNKYIQKITLNGVPHTRRWIDFAEIAQGGELVFEMGERQVDYGE